MSHLEERLDWVGQLLVEAVGPEALFGELPDRVNEHFRQYSKDIHPDHFAKYPAAHKRAEELLLQLNELKRRADARIAAGVYGTTKPDPKPEPKFEAVTLKSRGDIYDIHTPMSGGDFCDLFKAERRSHDFEAVVIKVTRDKRDNDLLDNEQKVLRKLYPTKTERTSYYRYLPELVDTFGVKGAAGVRRANVIRNLSGYVSLDKVLKEYSNGLDFRDAAWMCKRMLEVLGFVHRQGFVHGAIFPEHVMINPQNHGAVLVDWSYSVEKGKRVSAIVGKYKHLYPPEVLKKKPATPATDLYMWARMAEAMLTDVEPAPIVTFLKGCRAENPVFRPDDAWRVLEEYSELLRQLVGPPKFRPFHMPEVK